ncbi:MAG: hypothetical protein GY716_23535 [bacterium]|nr:hypothetical protein [bacterium]
MSHPLPPAAVLVAHRVADYAAWKRVFDDTRQFRKDDGIFGHDVSRDADAPERIYVYCPAADAAKLAAHLQNPKLKEIMQSAGVEGEPEVWSMNPMSADFIEDRKLPGMVVVHEVEDYSSWRKAYDDFDAHRKRAGIVGHAVNQDAGNPNRVIIYHQAEEMSALRAFVESSELREAMQSAGVVGRPDIRFLEQLDIQEY